VAYEFMIQGDKTPDKQFMTGKTDIASANTIDQFTGRLIDGLSNNGFFKSPDMRPTVERNLINLFARQTWTDQDIKTLQGVLSSFIKK
jgi:tRNA/rRNA methyltransferase